jgi:periplasmic copper chaperone A
MIRKSLLAVIVFAIGLVVLPAVAGAHVEIEADGSLSADGTQKATLTVPNECEGSETTNVVLNLPATPPLTTVDAAPEPGFTYATTKSADGSVKDLTIAGSITGSEEKKFVLTLATIPPDTTEIKMTALQNCADGSVIRWIEPTPANGEEPEHPAPVLEISSGGATSTSTIKVPVTTKDDSSSDSDNTGLIIGGVIAAVVVIGGVAFAVARRKSS